MQEKKKKNVLLSSFSSEISYSSIVYLYSDFFEFLQEQSIVSSLKYELYVSIYITNNDKIQKV